jgi:hypothetical protein
MTFEIQASPSIPQQQLHTVAPSSVPHTAFAGTYVVQHGCLIKTDTKSTNSQFRIISQRLLQSRTQPPTKKIQIFALRKTPKILLKTPENNPSPANVQGNTDRKVDAILIKVHTKNGDR